MSDPLRWIKNQVGQAFGVPRREAILSQGPNSEIAVDLLALLNSPSDLKELIKQVTGYLQKWTGCEAVGVRLKDEDDYPYFETRGFAQDFVQAENFLCTRDAKGEMVRDRGGNPVLECMCGNVLCGRFKPSLPFFTERGSFWSNCTTDLLGSTSDEDRQTRTRNRCNGEGYESVGLFRLQNGNDVLGLLQINDRRKNLFTPTLLSFLEYSADQIAIAIAQRKSQAELIKSEELYRSLFKNMLNGFAYCKMIYQEGHPWDFTYLAVNDAFEKHTGLKNVVGKNVTDVVPGFRERDTELLERYSRTALGGPPESFETYVETLKMWFSISVYCPQKGYFVAVFDVINDRKKTEADLERLKTAIEQAAEIIVVTDYDGQIEYANPAFEAVTGYKLSEALGQNINLLNSGKQDPSFYENMWATIRGGEIWRGQFVNKKRDGSLYTEQSTISPVRDAEGKIVSYVAVKHDISEFLRLQQDKEKIQEQFLQSQKMESVGRLAGGVAHDFNNMLNVITGHSELALREIDASHPLWTDLQEIKSAALRSADLTRQLLTFARKQIISPQVLDVNSTVQSMMKMLRRLIGEHIELVWAPDEAAWPVKMDPSQLNQILANLSVNARDAIKGVGKITIQTQNVHLQKNPELQGNFVPGDYVLLKIIDTGEGMNANVLNHVFEPFFTTKGSGHGTGLGLATVYGIVQQNKGWIAIESEVGKGTRINIYLPRHRGQVVAEPSRVSERPAQGTGERILLVEDEKSLLKMGKRILESLGYQVLIAHKPSEALETISADTGPIDLLISDIIMPEMSGRDLAEKISSTRPEIKKLFMSGYTADVLGPQISEDDNFNFIQKPFTIEDLAHKVRHVLEKK